MEAAPRYAELGSRLRSRWNVLNGWIGDAKKLPSRAVAAYVEKRSEPRRLASGPVEFGYADEHGRVLRAGGRLIDRSASGMRFFTSAQLQVGTDFLLWDQRRVEYAATVVWTKPRRGGLLVGAQIVPARTS